MSYLDQRDRARAKKQSMARRLRAQLGSIKRAVDPCTTEHFHDRAKRLASDIVTLRQVLRHPHH